MVAILIAGVSLLALLPLFVSSCRAALSSAGKFEPSERAKRLVDAAGGDVTAEHFGRILELLRLCPEKQEGWSAVRAIAHYHRFLEGLGGAFGGLSVGLTQWVLEERTKCAHFAAVALDRCIASSKELLVEGPGENRF
jgi:hypothetical protein